MVRENSLWAFAVVILFLAVLVPSLHFAANDNTVTETVTNESVTIGFDQPSAVEPPTEALGFEPNATVFNSSDTELVNGTDYEWRPSDGTIAWFDTANTTDGETATVTYQFEARTQRTRDINGVMFAFGKALPYLVLIAGVGAVFRYGGGW